MRVRIFITATILFLIVLIYYCCYLNAEVLHAFTSMSQRINTEDIYNQEDNVYEADYYKIFDSKRYDNYILYLGDKNTDTVAFIADTNLLKDCKADFNEINKNLLQPVYNFMDKKGYKDFVTYNSDTLKFEYKMWDVNHQYQIIAGNGSPGSNGKRIYTYNSPPYLIDKCDALR